jgi:feruloyl esterase
MGALEAIRFPKDFDGIIAGAPAMDQADIFGNYSAWLTKANTGPDGKPILSQAKVKHLQEAVYAACGEKSGVQASVIPDPRACRFEPSTLQCPAGGGAECLTPAEVTAAEKIYSGPASAGGKQLYSGGAPKGSEPYWPRWVTGAGAGPATMTAFAQDFYRYMAFNPAAGPTFDLSQVDLDKDSPRLAYTASIINAATFNPATGQIDFGDMTAFKQAGGKLIIYHGWADSVVIPQFTVDFYEALAKRSGGNAATQEFARLFMVPGMDHCGIRTNGPGIADTGIDPLTALEQWVEQGKAPTELIATKTAATGGQTLWRRPVCAYPKVARYNGAGDATDPANFTCAEP